MNKTTRNQPIDAFQKFAVAMESIKAREALTGFPLRDKISSQLATTNKINTKGARK